MLHSPKITVQNTNDIISLSSINSLKCCSYHHSQISSFYIYHSIFTCLNIFYHENSLSNTECCHEHCKICDIHECSTAISNKLQSSFRLYILCEHEHVQITRYRWGESGYNWHIMTQFCKITFFHSISSSLMPAFSSWRQCYLAGVIASYYEHSFILWV